MLTVDLARGTFTSVLAQLKFCHPLKDKFSGNGDTFGEDNCHYWFCPLLKRALV